MAHQMTDRETAVASSVAPRPLSCSQILTIADLMRGRSMVF